VKSSDPNAAGREKYQQMWDITANVIRNWDPYGLLAGGVPPDEFDHEIASLVAQIPRIKSGEDATLAVSRIFGSNFDSSSFPADSCRDAGEKLFAALLEKGLLR
jgi:hypothetical protein